MRPGIVAIRLILSGLQNSEVRLNEEQLHLHYINLLLPEVIENLQEIFVRVAMDFLAVDRREI